MSSLGVGLELDTELRFPKEGGFYKVVKACHVTGDRANFRAALARVTGACTQPERHQAEEWIAMLHAATASGKRSAATLEVTLDLYTNALLRYPADVARATCMRLATTEKWFPVLADVIELCEELFAERARLREALERSA